MSPEQITLGALLVTAIIAPTWLAWWNSKISRDAAAEAERQTKPNGGKSMRDSLDRTERALSDILNDLREVKADVREVKADVRDNHVRIAALEQRNPNARDRATDKET